MHGLCLNLMAIFIKNSVSEMGIIVSETLESLSLAQKGKLHVAPFPSGLNLHDGLSCFTAFRLVIIIAVPYPSCRMPD